MIDKQGKKQLNAIEKLKNQLKNQKSKRTASKRN